MTYDPSSDAWTMRLRPVCSDLTFTIAPGATLLLASIMMPEIWADWASRKGVAIKNKE